MGHIMKTALFLGFGVLGLWCFHLHANFEISLYIKIATLHQEVLMHQPIFQEALWVMCSLSSLIPSDMVKLTKAKTFQAYLDSCHRRYSCVHCRAHLANHDDLISKVSRPRPAVQPSA